MLLVKKKYEHYVNINTPINCENTFIDYNVYVVYFINCMSNKYYIDWLTNQMEIIKPMNAKIYIVASVLPNDETEFRDNVSQICPGCEIETYYENEFEYRGIMKVWELGRYYNKSNDIILYFHSKGISYTNNYEAFRNDEYNIILKDIDRIKEIFTLFPKIDKIGFMSGGCGWIWYNFWYARGSYINQVERPIKTQRRHYYEDWLGRCVKPGDQYCESERDNRSYYKNTLDTCYGFYTDKINFANIGSYFDTTDSKYHNICN